MGKSGQNSNFSLSYHILSMAGGFKKIAGKGHGVEYLILNFYLPRGHVRGQGQSRFSELNFSRVFFGI